MPSEDPHWQKDPVEIEFAGGFHVAVYFHFAEGRTLGLAMYTRKQFIFEWFFFAGGFAVCRWTKFHGRNKKVQDQLASVLLAA